MLKPQSSAVEDLQREICRKFSATYLPAPSDLKVGISQNIRKGVVPVNGLRHLPEGDTTGWYIWGGNEPSVATDFFQPLHVEHLNEWCPQAKKYLGLAPGWRFLITDDYEDVWFDEGLLQPE